MLKEKMIELVNAMDTEEKLQLHNEYCSQCDMDNYIYSMDEFNEILSGTEPLEVAEMCYFGHFFSADDYFKFNGYGNIDTMNNCDIEDEIYVDEIVAYIIDNEDPLYNDDIEELLTEYVED